jgi:phosphate transport system protein
VAASETRQAFRAELAELRETVLRMGTFVESMLERALQALAVQDIALAEEVHRSDDVPDRLDLDVEHAATRLLALQQPMAHDLRAIAGCLRMATELERIGDYAKDIAKTAVRLGSKPYFKPLDDIGRMGRRVREMLRLSLRCFADSDVELARQVAEMDRGVDEIWHLLRDELMERMRSDAQLVDQAAHLLLVARYLERAGDHAVNLVERVNYIETGRLEPLA